MAVIFLEGFDKYGPISELNPTLADLMIQGEWTSHGGTPESMNIVAGLSRTGTAFRYGGGTAAWVSKTLPGNYTTLIGGVRFTWETAGSFFGPIIQFGDVASAQVGIELLVNGTFSLVRGAYFGATTIDTSTASISQGETHYLEWTITFGNSAAYHLYLDGLSILSGTGDTQATSNAYANTIVIGNNSGLNGLCDITLDDLYLFDTTGSVNNAVLNTNPRIETRFPQADAQTEFINASSLFGNSNSINSGTNAPGSNTLFIRKFTSSVDQDIQSVSCIPAGTDGIAKFKAVVYSDSTGIPDALLSDGVEITGTTAGTTLTSVLNTPTSLTAATDYWIGFITDTSVLLHVTDVLTFGQKASNTYGSGAPDPAPAMTTSQIDWSLWGNCTGAATNWQSVSQNPVAGDLSAIASANVGDEDLYELPVLTASDATIYSIGVKLNFKRSDSGARTVDIRLLSGATDDPGTNAGITAGTDYSWHNTYFDQDPDGDIDWTLTTANAIQVGQKVAS